jgi:hypothetical protein
LYAERLVFESSWQRIEPKKRKYRLKRLGFNQRFILSTYLLTARVLTRAKWLIESPNLSFLYEQ